MGHIIKSESEGAKKTAVSDVNCIQNYSAVCGRNLGVETERKNQKHARKIYENGDGNQCKYTRIHTGNGSRDQEYRTGIKGKNRMVCIGKILIDQKKI